MPEKKNLNHPYLGILNAENDVYITINGIQVL